MTPQSSKFSNIVDAIQWHEGMLLAPHHFQQQALRHEQLLHGVMSSLAPFYWGILRLDIDKMRLADGQFCVLELEAILPDGLMIAHSVKQGDVEVTADLNRHHTDILQQQNLFVYLKVARHSTEPLEGEQRYRSVTGKPVKGMNQGEGEEVIPRWKPIISLSIVTAGDEPPTHRFAAFPLAEMTYRNQTWELTEFVPPTLRVASLSTVGNWVTHIIRQARSKANFLVLQLQSSTSIQLNQPLSFSTQNVLQGLAASLPPLEAMLATESSHPYPLYLGLCGLAGSVATFTQARVTPVFKPYNHNNLWANFQEVGQFILNEVLAHIQEFYIARVFDYQNQQGTLKNRQDIPAWLTNLPYFLLRLEPGQVLTDPRDKKEYIVIGLTSPDGQIEELFKNNGLIASVEKINMVRENRISGATRKLLDQGDDQ